jgi:hypothetical protein
MERGQHLLDIMNEVSARLDHAPASMRPVRVLDEMQAFMQIDPLLADLHKQYMDAKGTRVQAEKEFGRSDGMTDMAMMMEDSAWCAMQTRYMEVRANRQLMAHAQELIEESRLEDEYRRKKEKEREALRTFDMLQLYARMREAQKNFSAGWLIVAILYLAQQPDFFRNHHASYRFNRLAA